MKNLKSCLVGSLLIAAVAALSACNSGGGGGDPGPSNGLVGVNNTPGYIGQGDWSNKIAIAPGAVNTPGFQYLMYLMGGQYTQVLFVEIITTYPGMLPAQVEFKLSSGQNTYGGYSTGLDTYGYGSMNGNGLAVTYYGNQGTQTQCFAYPCPQQTNTSVPAIQINAQFTDQYKTAMNVQVIAQGTVVASGQIFGSSPGGQYGSQYPNTQYGNQYSYGNGYQTYPGYYKPGAR